MSLPSGPAGAPCTALASAAMSTAVVSAPAPGGGAGPWMPAAARRAVYWATGKLVTALSAP